ncbi:uncharacterized protein HGUI_01545 [Hanseniaspora guilliermondii]|uniref:Inheritance of peroxisomes protein 1 n=1 Tax=Hanseniaspora guilliermondii TaxID=56406 RepID=A0A1L0CLN9_9ASCO|nr:uncharacterized protein HGUI_01545 [Hanseniaspora guilliermondii]
MVNHSSHNIKRLNLKNILHIKSDNKSNDTSMNKQGKKNRPMSATRFTIFKNNNVTVYKYSKESKEKCILSNDIVEIYEIKTMNDIHENKVSIGKYITLGKNDRILKPFFNKVKMEKLGSCNVKLHWFNNEKEIWILNFESEDVCNEFNDNVLIAFERKDTKVSDLDIFLSEDEEVDFSRPSNESHISTKSSATTVDVLKMFKEAVSKMNEYNFDTQIEKHDKRSISNSSVFYKRNSLIDNTSGYDSTTRVNSDNTNRYKRYSTFEYLSEPRHLSSGDNRNFSNQSTKTVRRSALTTDI